MNCYAAGEVVRSEFAFGIGFYQPDISIISNTMD